MASTAKYAAKVPPSVTTPDTVQTRIGTLKFIDGLPDADTVKKVYDNLDFVRGVEAFLLGMPAANVQGLRRGFIEGGFPPNEGFGISEGLADARSLFLTPNTVVVYTWGIIDVKDGPMVLQVPPGVLGILDDAHFRFVTDLGLTGPDQGKGGKYLVVPPGYTGTLPPESEGYFVTKSRTYSNLVIMRAFVQGSDIATIVKNVKANAAMYPLSAAAKPTPTKFVNFSGMQINTVHANDFTFYEELNEVVQHEPDDFLESEVVGILASIGIKKGKPFAPDARMKAILTDAAAVANATSRAMTFASRDPLTKVLPRPAVDHHLHAPEPRVRRWRRTDAGCAHHVPLLLHRHNAGDGEPEAGPGRGLCVHRPRREGRMARRQQELQGHAAAQHSGQAVLVVQRL